MSLTKYVIDVMCFHWCNLSCYSIDARQGYSCNVVSSINYYLSLMLCYVHMIDAKLGHWRSVRRFCDRCDVTSWMQCCLIVVISVITTSVGWSSLGSVATCSTFLTAFIPTSVYNTFNKSHNVISRQSGPIRLMMRSFGSWCDCLMACCDVEDKSVI